MTAVSGDEYEDASEGEFTLDLEQVLISSFVRETSVQFRFPTHRHRDYARRWWTIYNTDGITYIATNSTVEKSKKEHFPVTYVVPDDDKSPEKLKVLTRELSQFTSELFDIEIVNFSLLWGVQSGKLPSLLGCDGTFRCTIDSEPYAMFLMEIGLFIALETGQVPEPGRCFSRRSACTGAEIACPRQKIEIWRIKELSIGLNVADRDEFLRYMKRRIGMICPALLVNSEYVCRGCFAVYSRERASTRGEETEMSSRSPRPLAGTPSIRASAPVNPARPNTALNSWYRSPSGLTYVQDIGRRALRQAHKTYITRPFPAFLQHPV
jgi:hypothetical protein